MLKKIAVLASGSGSDFQSIIDSIGFGEINNACIDILIAGKEGIYAIDRAKLHNIDYKVYNKAEYNSIEEMYDEMAKYLRSRQIDLIVLAGYLNILTANIITAYEGRIINIHPSLIPKFCGMGYYGMKVHQAVIDAGESITGATVHYVDEGADTGEIILQDTVPVLSDDTAETLHKRVLELEHKLLPRAVKLICNKI